MVEKTVTTNPLVYGIDWGVEGGDKTIEVEIAKLADGTMRVNSMREVIEGTCRGIKD